MLRRLELLLILLLTPLFAGAAPVRLAYLYSDGNIPGTLRAFETLLAEHPELRGQVELTLLSESTFGDVQPEVLTSANALVLDTMNEPLVARFDSEHGVDLIAAIARKGTVLGVGQGLLGEEKYSQQGVVWDPRARAYWTNSGAQNQLELMKLALTKAGIPGLALLDPEPSLDFGFYYPDGKTGRVFPSWEAFEQWRTANGKVRPGASRIAISFFKATYYSGDTALLDALIAEVERSGAEAIPLFGYPGAVAVQRLLKDDAGQPRADVVLGSNFNFSDFNASQLLEQVGLPVINLITLYGRSEAEWRASPTGLSTFEGTFNVAVPEFAGTVAPTVVGSKEKVHDETSGLTAVVTRPIPAQVTKAVQRALKFASLRHKPNAEKHIALMYYNFPPGKANIGASYLNVAESLSNILARMQQEGYDVGPKVPSADQVLADITTKARNVASVAPGELKELVAAGSSIRVPLAQYRQWLGAYAPALRNKIIKDWGEPDASKLMADRDAGGQAFLVPAVRYGNILLTPQPQRAWGEDLDKLYHAKDLAPHHQYVAAYTWIAKEFAADAIVHVGTHGTLEWLDGKDVGLTDEDPSDALIGDLPNAYIYNVDVVGEGLVARRRSMATLVDHMVPPFRKGGLTEELAALGEIMNDHTLNEGKNPEMATILAKQVRAQAVALGIAKDLGLDPGADWSDEQLHRIEDYLLDLKGQNIPYGLHAFGRTPDKDMRDSTVEAITSVDRSLLSDARKVFAEDMDARIVSAGPRELASLMKALSGGFLPTGNGGEPVRNPDVYPTGKNFYGIDPDKVPKPASWELGVKLADQMLADHFKKNGKYPEKVSFVIWGDETMRHEGVLESQIFRLLGTKPVWDARGKVVGVEVTPRAQLGRPRVDIIIASAAEGMFSNVTRLMDQAVQMAKAQDETDNLVRKHYLATKATLMAKGYLAADADRLAGVRIFDEPPGTYNLNTSGIAAASGSWDKDTGMANEYIRKMGHGYGNGFWGESMEDVFRLALAGTEKVVHSSSTTLYGALDNDDMFMYMGGLAAAVRSIDGATPDMVITNTRDPGKPEMTSIDKFVGQEFRSRYVNPTWIEGMKKEGYAGAVEMRAFTEYLWGWDATASNVVDDAMWQETFATYVEDKHDLGMKEFFEQNSPYAYQDITARMLETTRKGYWKADDATRATLVKEYIESVEQHGISCSDQTCSNARLLEYVLQQAKAAGVPVPSINAAQAAMEKAIGQSVAQAAAQLRAFAERNDAREQATADAARAAPGQSTAASAAPAQQLPAKPAPAEAQPTKPDTKIVGFLMETEDRSRRDAASAAGRNSTPSPFDALWLLLPLCILLLWRQRTHGTFAH